MGPLANDLLPEALLGGSIRCRKKRRYVRAIPRHQKLLGGFRLGKLIDMKQEMVGTASAEYPPILIPSHCQPEFP